MAIAHLEGRRIRILGTVQGVGFRPWVYRTAQAAGVTGRVRNDAAGVTVEVFGDQPALDQFIDALHSPPPAATIERLELIDIAAEPAATGFQIVQSELGPERRVSLPPDHALCDACLTEIYDPSNRRYRYPFTNCTNCGPRFTIATGVPYDRASTTMAAFTMCPACRREYDDPADRRFHAQPNACAVCGPRVSLHAHDGEPIEVDDPIASAAEAITFGLIVAVKGIGGFHLACDATSDQAVRELRVRKRRDEKPLAVMVRDLNDASALGLLGEEQRRLLAGADRPIVLVPKREGSPLAESVAPGNRLVGIILAYSPLHHLLLADAGVPLVMTSGNISDEPIAFRNDDAVRRLGVIADLFLLHNRDIEARADDSVVAVIAGRGTVIRRSRGRVPRAVRVAHEFARPVLACGALLKNTFCLASGASAWLGPHIGDLENLETYESYTTSIRRMETFLDVRPQVIAHDLHPDYLSSIYARRRPETVRVAVQHHHAHIVSVMAERGIEGSVIGLAYDGTGYGTDGTMWGGEVLVATTRAFTRAATFRALPLIGGDRAIREPWRLALALVVDAFDGELPPEARARFADVPERDRRAVLRLLVDRMPAPLARGVGRYFDAFGALFLGRSRASFEGQVALEWNQIADPRIARTYRFQVDVGPYCDEIDLRPTVRDALFDAAAGQSIATVAAAFHNTLAEATAEAVRRAAKRVGSMPVVASGGCFQNARLAEEVRAALAPEHEVYLHEVVPPGDGGIALGQAVIANALTERQG
ncbi:MAG: carbamoyltransferase HypF [Vicinamibacterales bacterium]